MKWQIFYSMILALNLIGAHPAEAQRVAFPDNAVAAGNSPGGQDDHVSQWFAKYDQIRRTAQMTPSERQRADNLMAKGLSIVVPGPEKATTSQLLIKLVNKNAVAANQMKQLPLFKETEQLHRGYYQYFVNAQTLFADYLKVQQNIFAQDASGKALAGQLMPRKQDLEALDQNNKALDAQIRQQYGIPAYRNPY